MASITLFPNADGSIGLWKNQSGLSTNLYQSVDEGTDTPNDSDYLETFENGSDTLFLSIQDMPTLLSSVTSVVVKLRCQRTDSGSHATRLDNLQIFQNDEVTALTSSVSISDGTSIATLTLSPSIIGSTSKSAWDGAKIRIVADSNSDIGSAYIYAIQVELVYSTTNSTYNESGSGGSVVGGLSSIRPLYTPVISGGALGGSKAFFTHNLIATGGVLIGGGIGANDINGSGGATIGSSAICSLILNSSNKVGTISSGISYLIATYNILSSGGALGGGRILKVDNIESSGGTLGGGLGFFYTLFTKFGTSSQGTKVASKNIEDSTYNIIATGGAECSGAIKSDYSYNITGGCEIGGTSPVDIGIIAKGGVIGSGGNNLDVSGRGGIIISGTSKIQIEYSISEYNDNPGGLWTGSKYSFIQNLSTDASAEVIISLSHDNIFSWRISYRDLENTPIIYLGLYRVFTWVSNLLDYSVLSNYGAIGKVNIPPNLLTNPNLGWSIEIITPTNPNNGELTVDFPMPQKTTATIQLSTQITTTGGGSIGGSAEIIEVDLISGGTIAGGTPYTSLILTNINSAGGSVCSGIIGFNLNGIVYNDEKGKGGATLGGTTEISDIRDGALIGGSASINVIYQTSDRLPLLGEFVVPPKEETNSGSFQFSKNSNIISWEIQYNGLESELTSILLRGPAEEGEIGPTVIDLSSISGLMMPNIGSFVIPNSLISSASEDQYYVELYANNEAILRHQIILNGSGIVCGGIAEAPADITSFGGVQCSGSCINNSVRRVLGTGGAECGGVSFISRRQNRRGSGGVTIGSATAINVNYSPSTAGGASLNGGSSSFVFIYMSGGVTCGSSATVLPLKYISGSGGVTISGNIQQQNFYLSKTISGGVIISGRSNVYRLSELVQVTLNISRVLSSDNEAKENELNLIQLPNKLIQVKDEDTPLSERSDLNYWCEPEIRCEEGIVPKVVKKRQTTMPANKIIR